jgi:hypothetical protein
MITAEYAIFFTRLGLVVDALSVFLLAPEIIGSQRLKRFRDALEKFMKGIYRWAHWYSPLLWDKNLETRLPRNAMKLSWTTRILVILLVALCPLTVSIAALFLGWFQGWEIWLQTILWILLFLFSSLIGFLLLTYVGEFALGAIKTLSNNERLRGVLFGAGVFCFISGFILQFLGTF